MVRYSGIKWSGIVAFVPDCKKVYLCDIMERQAINNAIINYLSPYRPERIGIFGSFARHEEKKDSDIDILVKFKETISLLELVRIHRELSALLGKRVDLITEQALKNERIKKYIYEDLQIIFE
jgi:hypothetical protein